MTRPLVIAYHLVMTAYGWWLPNDPRGSTSKRVASVSLEGLGEHHFGRRTKQPPSKDIRRFYREAEEVLTHDLLEFRSAEIEVVAEASRTLSLNIGTPVTPARFSRTTCTC